MLPVLVLLCIGFTLLNDRFITIQNLQVITQQASINLVLACGMTVVILTGGIDLSVGSILAASAVAGVAVSLSPAFGALAPLAALGVGLGCGLLNGLLIGGFGLSPFIVTLGGLTAIRGLARMMGEDRTVINPELAYDVIGNAHLLGVHSLVWTGMAVALLTWVILRRTVLGVRIYSVGGNMEAARMAGIRVWVILLVVYAYSGLLAGLTGVMASARLYSANGLQMGQAYELDAIAAVILGGTSFTGGQGGIVGTIVGVLIIAVLSNGLVLAGVPDIWQYIIKGSIIIFAVALDRLRTGRG
jgi:ribose transport system permease protein